MEGKEQQVRKILSFHLSRGERTGNRGGTVPLKHQVTLEEEDTEMELLWGTRTEGRGGLGWKSPTFTPVMARGQAKMPLIVLSRSKGE